MMVCLANKTFDSTNWYELLKICLAGSQTKTKLGEIVKKAVHLVKKNTKINVSMCVRNKLKPLSLSLIHDQTT